MTRGLFAPRARRELREAATWIAEDNPDAAEAMLRAAVRAAEMIAATPAWRGFVWIWRLDASASGRCGDNPYLLVFDVDRPPPVAARFVHQARDLPVVLSDLDL